MLGNKKADKTESDVQRDRAVAGSRAPRGEFVGRACGADEGYEDETGAERRGRLAEPSGDSPGHA